MSLVVGAGQLDRVLEDAEHLLVQYRTDDGLRYLDYQPSTDPNQLMPEDLAVTILINSRVGPSAFKSVQDKGSALSLEKLPMGPLEDSTSLERDQVADIISEMAGWNGFAASVATKILHKKRPRLIPILDNEAIFGAYMNPRWPEQRASQESVYARNRIREALEWIRTDLTRSENSHVCQRSLRWNLRDPGSSCSTWSGGYTFENCSPFVHDLQSSSGQVASRRLEGGNVGRRRLVQVILRRYPAVRIEERLPINETVERK